MKKSFVIVLSLLCIAGPALAQTSATSTSASHEVVILTYHDVVKNHEHLVRIARYNGQKSSYPFKAYMQVYQQLIQQPKDRDAMQDLVQVQQITAKYLDGDMSKLFKQSFTKKMTTEDILSIYRAFF